MVEISVTDPALFATVLVESAVKYAAPFARLGASTMLAATNTDATSFVTCSRFARDCSWPVARVRTGPELDKLGDDVSAGAPTLSDASTG